MIKFLIFALMMGLIIYTDKGERKAVVNVKHLQRDSLDFLFPQGLYTGGRIAIRKDKKSHVWYVERAVFYPSRIPLVEQGKVVLMCCCKYGFYTDEPCAHIFAAMRYLASLEGYKVSFWDSREEAERQRKLCMRLNKYVWVTLRRSW